MLDRDTAGRDTPFMKNRDKFIKGLAASNPDNFLYNFRDAFGQPQPAEGHPAQVPGGDAPGDVPAAPAGGELQRLRATRAAGRPYGGIQRRRVGRQRVQGPLDVGRR